MGRFILVSVLGHGVVDPVAAPDAGEQGVGDPYGAPWLRCWPLQRVRRRHTPGVPQVHGVAAL
jgi:hypothetical protein